MTSEATQKEKLLGHLARNSLARSRELLEVGVSRTAISRALDDGDIVRIGRGLYQLADADFDLYNASLAEAAKRVPKAVICLLSALAFHGLTDQIPRKVWIAIGAKDWKPKLTNLQVRTVRFREPYFSQGREVHSINSIEVNVYSIPKSIADAFRNPKLVDRAVAIESMKSALSTRKASPAELVAAANAYGGGERMRQYLEALTANG